MCVRLRSNLYWERWSRMGSAPLQHLVLGFHLIPTFVYVGCFEESDGFLVFLFPFQGNLTVYWPLIALSEL